MSFNTPRLAKIKKSQEYQALDVRVEQGGLSLSVGGVNSDTTLLRNQFCIT